jgi:hypothetical protein
VDTEEQFLNRMRQHMLSHLVNPPVVVDHLPSGIQHCKKQKEDKMLRQELNFVGIAAQQATETELQRSHLIKGLRNLRDAKLDSLEIDHGLSDDEVPKTFNEFLKRVKSGDVIYHGSKDGDHEHSSGVWYHLRWRNPKKTEDRAGFKKAAAELQKKFDAAKDEIVVLPLDQGLAAKRAFEAAIQ